MPDPHWENLKEIFHAAVTLAPQERAAYLDRACNGDASLRQGVSATSSQQRGRRRIPKNSRSSRLRCTLADVPAGASWTSVGVVISRCDVTGSRKSYQDFFALWKDADSDLPVLIDARKQYEQLKLRMNKCTTPLVLEF